MSNLKLWMAGKPVKTEEDYREVLGLIEQLEDKIEGQWQDPSKQPYVACHQFLANAMLGYEIDNDKLPIGKEEEENEPMPF